MNMPVDQMQAMPQEAQGPQMLTDDDEADIDIASAAALQILSQPEMEDMLVKTMQSPNPIPLLATNLAELIEEVMESSKATDLELNPHIWFAEGGVFDDIADELSDIVGADIASMMPELKPEILKAVQKKAEDFKQRGIGQQQEQPPTEQAPPQSKPLMLGA